MVSENTMMMSLRTPWKEYTFKSSLSSCEGSDKLCSIRAMKHASKMCFNIAAYEITRFLAVFTFIRNIL